MGLSPQESEGSTPLPELMTMTEVAEALRVSVQSVSRWSKDGTLPSIQIGAGTVRFRRSDVEALLHPDQPAASAQ
jgi:excisionase family DNA binding protein